jgi:hypothetical protein
MRPDLQIDACVASIGKAIFTVVGEQLIAGQHSIKQAKILGDGVGKLLIGCRGEDQWTPLTMLLR